MWTLIRDFTRSFLFDEAAFQRYVAAVLYFLGSVASHGGVIPGTEVVIPHLQWTYEYGDVMKMLSLYLAAGGKLPSFNRPTNGGK